MLYLNSFSVLQTNTLNVCSHLFQNSDKIYQSYKNQLLNHKNNLQFKSISNTLIWQNKGWQRNDFLPLVSIFFAHSHAFQGHVCVTDETKPLMESQKEKQPCLSQKNNFINPFMLHLHLFKQKLHLYKTNNLVKAICCGFSQSVSHFLFT